MIVINCNDCNDNKIVYVFINLKLRFMLINDGIFKNKLLKKKFDSTMCNDLMDCFILLIIFIKHGMGKVIWKQKRWQTTLQTKSRKE